jgi:glycosyl transferase, family 25
MHAYVINLERSTDRRAHIMAELAKTGIDYEFIRGVEGRDLDSAVIAELVTPSVLASDWFQAGVLGCGLSHLSAYRKILADGHDMALVLEDDIRVPTDLGPLADAIGAHLTGAEVALLSYGAKTKLLLSRAGAIDLPTGRTLALPIDASQDTAAAYIITRAACERYVERMLPLAAMNDDWRHHYLAGFFDRLRCVAPMPVTKDSSFGSTVEHVSLTSPRMRIRDAAIRYKLTPIVKAIVYRRELIYRRAAEVRLVDEPFREKPSRIG